TGTAAAAFWRCRWPAARRLARAEQRRAPVRSARFEDAEAVDPIERRHLVAFGQGRVVEHRIDEIVDLAAARQYRLADVDQLARPFADDVDAEQLPGLAVKNQLQ